MRLRFRALFGILWNATSVGPIIRPILPLPHGAGPVSATPLGRSATRTDKNGGTRVSSNHLAAIALVFAQLGRCISPSAAPVHTVILASQTTGGSRPQAHGGLAHERSRRVHVCVCYCSAVSKPVILQRPTCLPGGLQAEISGRCGYCGLRI